MQSTNIPPKFTIPTAQNDGARANIPPTSPDDTRASQSLGFPPRTGLPPEAGGVPPQLSDMNGILNQLSGPIRWYLMGGRFGYDQDFAANPSIGGYPRGASLPSEDGRGDFLSAVDDNASNPNTLGAGWIPGYHYGETVLTGVTGGVVTLSQSQAAKRVIRVSGTLLSNLVLVVPAWQYNWVIYNGTTGAFSVSIRVGTGVAAAIPQNGAPSPVTCDGVECALASPNIAPATSGSQAVRLDQVGGGLLGVRTFNATGTYNKNPLARFFVIEVIGGGGGINAASETGRWWLQSGGGGGAYRKHRVDTADVAASTPVTVAASALQGGLSSFGASLSANGGQAGFAVQDSVGGVIVATSGGDGGQPGTGTLGTALIVAAGAAGSGAMSDVTGNMRVGANGGASGRGDPGSGRQVNPAAPVAATNAGGGTGGAGRRDGVLQAFGGPGQVTIWEYA